MFSQILSFFGLDRNERKPLEKKEVASLYEREMPSFVDLLPYTAFDSKTKTFILEDCVSRAKVFTIEPVATEGRDTETLVRIRDKLTDFFQSLFPEYSVSDGQWIIQQYCYDDSDISVIADQIQEYAVKNAKNSEYTNAYCDLMRNHLTGISKNENGIFFDDVVTKSKFIGKYRRTKLIIYRRCTNGILSQSDFCPAQEINEMSDRVINSLTNAGFKINEDTPKDFFSWLIKFFNPNPDFNKDDYYRIYSDILAREADGEIPVGGELVDSLVGTPPRSSATDNCWYFDDTPVRFIRIAGCRTPPRIGQLTGEVINGTGKSQVVTCALDKLPAGTVLCQTTVICPQSEFESIIFKQRDAAFGEGNSVERKKEELDLLENAIGRNFKIVRNFMGVYVFGSDLAELKSKSIEVCSVIHDSGLNPIKESHDCYGLKAFQMALPMVFNPQYDTQYLYHKPTWGQWVANMSFAFGRSEGTGNPCFTWFNRGGSPLSVDPFSKADKESNNFGIVIGAPGSGKSATTNALAAAQMAVYRPIMFIFDPGNSFGILGDYFARHDLKVAKTTFNMTNPTPLSLFKDAIYLDGKSDDFNDQDEVTSERDILGELELVALLMITGGEKKEYESYRRSDRQMLRRAIIQAGKYCLENKIMCRPEHVRNALGEIGNGSFEPERYGDDKRKTAANMAESLDMFCQAGTLENAIFNSEANGIPDADVVIIDLAMFAREGYETQLAIAVIGYLQYINALAEKQQSSGRIIQLFVDEAHLVTTNPLLAVYLVKMVKMFRKINVSLWLITQNFKDFPKDSEKLLSMIEWYIVMLASEAEVEAMAQFKNFSPEIKNMMLSARKSDKKYTEGVIVSNKTVELFRAVPPSLVLTMAMTDPDEKRSRAELCKQLSEQGKSCDALDGAIEEARLLDNKRGIVAAKAD